jgi:hypothetical protein
MEDPVHQNQDGKWYFWDEVWAYEYGPFDTEDGARKQLTEYCDKMLGL